MSGSGQIGLENRTSILPSPALPAGGMFSSDYSISDNIPLPGEVGVRSGDQLSDVVDSVKAAAFYIDMIGFGESSSSLTKGMPLKPLGVNTWIRTGQKCSNGADSWMYNEGIPQGTAVGERIKDGLASAGLPGMRGMAPGMMEDAKAALNPIPVMKAVFGSGYPSCRLVEKEVGDQDGRIQNPKSKKYYIENPDSVVKRNGKSYQSQWVQEEDMSQNDWEKVPKTFCPDGFAITSHSGGKCDGRLLSSMRSTEGFSDISESRVKGVVVMSVGFLLLFTLSLQKFRR